MSAMQPLSRRVFIGSATTTAFSLWAGTARGMGRPARRRPAGGPFCFAQIGCGGKGRGDMKSVIDGGAKLAGMCDVDPARAADAFKQHSGVPVFSDYRKMLDALDGEIDGVVISTPDHVHAVMALEAMRRGKHVYVQKPLARTFEECRLLLESARKYRVVTQMGNQGHSGVGLKVWRQFMRDGAIGDIQEVAVWSSRPIWPQGMATLPAAEPVPAGLDWDSWIGPQTMRDFSSAYVPFKWRGWWDFGCGALGDMACHNMDPAFDLLKLGLPVSIKAEASAPAGVAYPDWSIIEFKFPATPVCPKGVKLTWYDGKKLPPPPPHAHPQFRPGGEGCMMIGSKMTVAGGSHAAAPYPVALTGEPFGQAVKDAEAHWRQKAKELQGDNHYTQWVEAAKKGDTAATGSNFEYAVPMTQAILLGCIALRFPGRELQWDHQKKRFSNCPEANAWLKFKPRSGFRLSV